MSSRGATRSPRPLSFRVQEEEGFKFWGFRTLRAYGFGLVGLMQGLGAPAAVTAVRVVLELCASGLGRSTAPELL